MAKVDVVTVNEAHFNKWCWWSCWVDVAVFNYSSGGHLLQMKVSRKNKKAFRAVGFEGGSSAAHANVHDAGDLIQMSRTKD